MTVGFLILMCEKRIEYLNSAKASAMSTGDMVQISSIDEQLAVTISTLTALRSLL